MPQSLAGLRVRRTLSIRRVLPRRAAARMAISSVLSVTGRRVRASRTAKVVRIEARLQQLQARVGLELQEIVEAAGDGVAAVHQDPVQQRRDTALTSAQVMIARTQGQAVGVAHRGHADDFDGNAQVFDHLADDRQLLEVLLAEHGQRGRTILNSLLTTVVTPSKCPGRLLPHRVSERSGTRTMVWAARPSG
jgi:hypothetical protein